MLSELMVAAQGTGSVLECLVELSTYSTILTLWISFGSCGQHMLSISRDAANVVESQFITRRWGKLLNRIVVV